MAEFVMSEQVRARLADEGIGEDLIVQTLSNTQLGNDGFFDEEGESFFLPTAIGSITLWIQYRFEGDAVRILDAYYHRIQVQST